MRTMGYIIEGQEPPKRISARPTDKGAPVMVAASLAFRWYDEIERGAKRVEYRDITEYWSRLLWDGGRNRRVKSIKFTRGYTQTKMIWEVRRIVRDEREGVFEIHLGKRIA